MDSFEVNLTPAVESFSLNLTDAGDNIEVIFSEGIAQSVFDLLVTRVQQLEQLHSTGDVDASEDAVDSSYTYNAYHYTAGNYVSHRYSLATGLAAGVATGTGSIPTNLTTLTYI